MAWFDATRWTAACCAIGVVIACGGRSVLLPGESFNEAGASTAAGKAGASRGGTGGQAAGGFAMGGFAGLGVAGSEVGGTANSEGGAPNSICVPESRKCFGDALLVCDRTGSSSSTESCGAGTSCFEIAGVGQCRVCEPYSRRCGDERNALVCAGDGTSWNTAVDCDVRGQRCYFGGCRSLSCRPGQAFCDESGMRLCDSTGTMHVLSASCDAGQYCDSSSLSCEAGVCAPDQPACNATIATTCNADGTDFVAGGEDCDAQPGRQCIAGVCLCRPGLANCNDDPADGCETDVASDPENCLSCAATCSSAHLSNPTCDNGCKGECDVGFEDCNDDKQADGCETNLRQDDRHCGACGVVCASGESCQNGQCRLAL